MAGDYPAHEFGSWKTAGQPLEVRYSLAVLEQLRAAAEEAFRKFSHGGLEIGAVLYGRREPGRIWIGDWRAISCEHAFGPGFELSASDERALEALLRLPASDPTLLGLEPVGWFHSHTRSDLSLRPRDLEIHQRFFSRPWQVALVLRPQQDDSMQAAFFPRAEDGTLPGIVGPESFSVTRNPAAVVGTVQPPRPAAPPPPPEAASPGRVALPQPKPILIGWLVAAVIAGVLVAVGGSFWFEWRASRPAGPVTISIREDQNRMTIAWDRDAEAVRRADRALLQIVDDRRVRDINMGGEEVRRGTFSYVRSSDEVLVRLTLYHEDGQLTQEFARYLGPRIEPGLKKQVEQVTRERDQLAQEVATMREELMKERARVQQLRRNLSLLESRLRAAEERMRRQGSRP